MLLLITLCFSAVSVAEKALPLTQQSAAKLIAGHSGNKVISTNIDKDKPALFRVKTLSEKGHIKVYRVNSATGKIQK